MTDLLKEIELQLPEEKIALVIRHGDRDKIPSGQFGDDILLNKKGKENSFAFGESLQKYKVNRILTSPIQRCVQTAEFISMGYGKDLEIVQTPCLGDPGLHILDAAIAGKYFLEHGFHKILEEFIDGKIPPGLRDQIQYQKMMTNFIYNNTCENGLTLFVTHDALIALYHYCIAQKIYTPENWVKYLGGFIINISK